MPPRYFTVEQANRLLPELSPLLESLRSMKRELVALQAEMDRYRQKARGNGHNYAAEIADVAGAHDRVHTEANDVIARITALGIELKDVELGLVDFPSIRHGRRVYLCWKLGEPRVAYWHDPESGYAGRQPLPGPTVTDDPS
ncbi:MAG: DUF2203 domain-containing protein [Dehalococcoidia bacterium]|nr:DUF2203 domain-containing protein [Dehalococcoidia bacterium]